MLLVFNFYNPSSVEKIKKIFIENPYDLEISVQFNTFAFTLFTFSVKAASMMNSFVQQELYQISVNVSTLNEKLYETGVDGAVSWFLECCSIFNVKLL